MPHRGNGVRRPAVQQHVVLLISHTTPTNSTLQSPTAQSHAPAPLGSGAAPAAHAHRHRALCPAVSLTLMTQFCVSHAHHSLHLSQLRLSGAHCISFICTNIHHSQIRGQACLTVRLPCGCGTPALVLGVGPVQCTRLPRLWRLHRLGRLRRLVCHACAGAQLGRADVRRLNLILGRPARWCP